MEPITIDVYWDYDDSAEVMPRGGDCDYCGQDTSRPRTAFEPRTCYTCHALTAYEPRARAALLTGRLQGLTRQTLRDAVLDQFGLVCIWDRPPLPFAVHIMQRVAE